LLTRSRGKPGAADNSFGNISPDLRRSTGQAAARRLWSAWRQPPGRRPAARGQREPPGWFCGYPGRFPAEYAESGWRGVTLL